ncbi:hypothetical protein TRIUR3_12833 [Triticum urartu]|uniref:Uncharacterized protein n=1 Tax=Triticum urartu TaxID=4572 RepID=M7YYC5_TRIUA|nr:hypothetical protein TRIUR3_12833 [Triticum urartu]
MALPSPAGIAKPRLHLLLNHRRASSSSVTCEWPLELSPPGPCAEFLDSCSLSVMPGVHYGTRESVGCAAELVKRGVAGVRDFRFFDGFCGWEREQLRDEVRAGLWRVAACSPAVLGLTGIGGGLWEEVQQLVGKRRVRALLMEVRALFMEVRP